MARAAKAGKGPLAQELARTMQDMQVGQSRRQAYESLASRTGVPPLRKFVRAIIQADLYGIAVADVLRTQADQLRIKRRQRAEEKAMQIPIKVIFPLDAVHPARALHRAARSGGHGHRGGVHQMMPAAVIVVTALCAGVSAFGLSRWARALAGTESRWLQTWVLVPFAGLGGVGAAMTAETVAELVGYALLAVFLPCWSSSTWPCSGCPTWSSARSISSSSRSLTVAAAMSGDWGRLGRAAAGRRCHRVRLSGARLDRTGEPRPG